MSILDNMYISLKNRIAAEWDSFKDESGVSAFVATILLILIVVLLCVAFWGKIQEWFDATWSKITAGSDSIS